MDALLRRLLAIIIRNSQVVVSWVGILLITRQLFEGLSLRLRNAQRGEDAQEHEECVDLHDVALVWVGDGVGVCAFSAELGNAGLPDDGADLAHTGGKPVRGGAVAGREAFTGDDEGSSVRAYMRVSRMWLCG